MVAQASPKVRGDPQIKQISQILINDNYIDRNLLPHSKSHHSVFLDILKVLRVHRRKGKRNWNVKILLFEKLAP
jgi:hypothetical protein